MKIKKTSETRPLAGHIANEYADSQNSAYSTEYINTQLDAKIDDDKFIIEVVNFGNNTIGGNSQKGFTLPDKAGYTSYVLKPIATQGYNDLYAVYIPGNSRNVFGIKNISGTSYTWGIQCVALYVKNSN